MDIRVDALESDHFYHIYNRGINSEKIFLTEENYYFFLRKAKEYLSGFVDFYAYCLMPNHFHFVVRVKSENEIIFNLNNEEKKTLPKFQTLAKLKETGLHSKDSLISKQFAKFLSSYTQAFNKQNNRHGALLERPFKRKRILSEDYLRRSIIYVHQNPLDLGVEIHCGKVFATNANIFY